VSIRYESYCTLFTDCSGRPSDYKELFNLRHAQARNVIEHIFGVVKRRFQIMAVGPEYSLHIQALLVSALCVLHNFIRIHDPDDFDNMDLDGQLERRVSRRNPEDFGHTITHLERVRAGQKRDAIAHTMWNQYIEYMQRQN
jgi:hypothetical protein